MTAFGNKRRPPSRARLAAVRAAAREFNEVGLIEMRRRFVVAGEPRAILQLVDAEIRRRGRITRAHTR